jgi:hypothetical protein
MRDDRASLQVLMALDGSTRGLRRDACGDWPLPGQQRLLALYHDW